MLLLNLPGLPNVQHVQSGDRGLTIREGLHDRIVTFHKSFGGSAKAEYPALKHRDPVTHLQATLHIMGDDE
jgi:hypothetical protein